MARVPEYFNVGDREDMTVEKLLVIIEELYTQLAVALNQKPDLVQRATNGLVTDTFLSNGTININSNTDNVEILTNHPTATTVTWVQIS